jgi:hypothetical protein
MHLEIFFAAQCPIELGEASDSEASDELDGFEATRALVMSGRLLCVSIPCMPSSTCMLMIEPATA